MKLLVLLLLTTTPLVAADPAGIAFFEQKVRPVLVEHCYSCHSTTAEKIKGNLLLDSKAGWEKGGDSGEVIIVPGEPESSLLIRCIQHLESGLEMPPDAPKLPDAVIADLVTWIKLGAPDPRDGVKVEAKRGDKSWWSLQPLRKDEVGVLKDAGRIDEFVAAKLAENGLTMNPPADARSLIRRVTYDLHGLPPTPEDVKAFVHDSFDNPKLALSNLIDRLLASPRYGERWGRHWLDVIRFGESIGFERNVIIDDLWPFRDYVIQSINDDKPFNQFIVEHLAGDVVGKDNPQVEVGTAFLVAGPYDDVGNQDVVAQANIRAATLDDIITATSGAFLGLTVNCARCHHHKFDPIPTEDYYRLRSAFEGITHGRRVMATSAARAEFAAAIEPLNIKKDELSAERKSLEDSIDQRAQVELENRKHTKAKIDPQLTEDRFTPVPARFLKFVIRANTENPKSGAGSGRLTEFEVWTTGDDSRNVALAANGGQADGPRSTFAEDFPTAYGPQFTIDGTHGEQWFIGSPAELKITLANEVSIDRITFANAKGQNREDKAEGAFPCEYDIQVSLDGQSWQTVASGNDREPWTTAHGIQRVRREIITADESAKLDALNAQIADVQAKINRVPNLPQVWAGNFSQPTTTFVHKGGDPMKPGESIVPASLNVLDRVTTPYELAADANEGERRLALAKWITRDDNALTARVLANRVWQYHFGTGIVDTPSDFGFLGSQPTHPELLDYLATRLIANDWKLKALHRELLLSRTYQQSSDYHETAAKADKDSRLLWRFPPRRLSAEELRDTMLSMAGKLQLEPMGGPGFRLYKFTQNNVCTYFPLDQHGPETYRRAVYHQNARASIVDVLNDFDLPDNAFAAPKRANTTTPLQALTLLNHRFTIDMSKSFAARLDKQDPVESAFAIAFQREPTVKERAAAEKLIAVHGTDAFCRALLNANELLYVQ